MDGVIAAEMTVKLVDFTDVGDVKHNAANVGGNGLVEIFFNHRVAAVAVGNAGDGIGMNGVIEFAKVLFAAGNHGQVDENRDKTQTEQRPQNRTHAFHRGIGGDVVVKVAVGENQIESKGRQQGKNHQLDGFEYGMCFFHHNGDISSLRMNLLFFRVICSNYIIKLSF